GHVTGVQTCALPIWAFYQQSRTVNHLDHDAAIRALLARVLVSPAFLYRVETVAGPTERPLSSWELASRLSFFLWSSIPDQELRQIGRASCRERGESP